MRTHDHEQLKAVVDDAVATGGRTLAAETWWQASSVYGDPERLRLEHELVFDRYPLVAGCSSELPEPTSFMARDVAGTPVIIARQADGSVRAFLNSCRHRATELIWGETSGCTRRFTCPYHGWTYGIDGQLLGITTTVGFPDVDRSSVGLVELGCAERHGLIWIARRPGRPVDLDAYLGPLDTDLQAMELGECVLERTFELSPEANWKLIADGFLETYHVRFLHAKTLTAHLYSDRDVFRPFGRHGRLVSQRKTYDAAQHVTPEDFLGYVLVNYQLFPNTFALWAADHFELWQIQPDRERPDRTRVRVGLLVRPDMQHLTERWTVNQEITTNIIVSEDFACAAATQRALSGNAAPPKVFYGRNEPMLQHFHQQLVAALADPLDTQSAPQEVSVSL